jgi:murein L,D-transpeptidase YcbB/YkuD
MQRQMTFSRLRRWMAEPRLSFSIPASLPSQAFAHLRSLGALLLLSIALPGVALADENAAGSRTSASIGAASEPQAEAGIAPEITGAIAEPKALADTAEEGHLPAAASAAPIEPKSPAAPDTAPAADTKKVDTAKVSTSAESLPALVQAELTALVAIDPKAPQAAEKERRLAGLAAFYTMRNFEPVWSQAGQATVAARAIIERLQHAPDDGLDLGPMPDLISGSDQERVKADLALSEAVVHYAREAAGGRIDPKTISPLIGAKLELPDAFDILTAVTQAGEKGGAVLWAYNPPQKPYQALREKLAEMRRETPVAQRIPSGPDLTVGMSDPRVSLIRSRFGLDGQPTTAQGELVYDTKVAAAVADFQKARGLPVSGVLTARTIAALSGGQPSRLENEIIANMERWRWLPRDLGETHIAVNIPDFTVALIRDDQVVTRHRVVVGKPDTPTPVFSNKMQYLIVNPYWNVPQSIIKNEFLKKAAGDLSYLTAQGYDVGSHDGHFVVRQPPGEKNALGRIKFLFPNDYAVYLHDTPSKALFAASRRAFSHGCVRVDQPFSFAADILGPKWSEEHLKSLLGPSERYINLPVPLPIHIEYFTTYVDESGRLQLRDDIYGYSHRVKVALGLER